MTHFIGIDSSTTATKAILVDEHGAVAGVASSEYPFDTPRPLWSEQPPGFVVERHRPQYPPGIGR